VRDWIPVANAGAVVLVVAGLGLLQAFPDSLGSSFAGMFAILLGIALLSPFFTTLILPWLERGLRRIFGVHGGLAARTVVRAISRTSVAIAALMVALSVTIGVGIMIDSFRSTVENWLDLTLRADVYVSAPSLGGTRPTADLDPALKGELAGLAGVRDIETFRAVTVESEFGLTQLSVADASRQRDARLYRFAQASPERVWDQVREGAVIVSESYSFRNGGLGPGSEVNLITSKGPVDFPIVGVFYDYASDRGTVLIADEIYRRHWEDDAISSLALYLEPGADGMQVIERVQRKLAGSGLLVQANRAIRDRALEIFDRTFAITAALRLLAVVVAFIGVLSANLALQLERTREMATLQALGLSERGMWGLTTLESGLMGFVAGVLSLPTGLILALVLIYVINLRSFGWTIALTADPWLFVQALVVAVGAATLAGIYPMLRLRRTELTAALRAE
jgi:putative ABC transport system permease protein